jgi:hypothetical protein
MGARGPQSKRDGRVKWGIGPRVRPETREFIEKICAEERYSVADFVARLIEDEHARRLLASIEE